MKVKDITKLTGTVMFRLIDATRQGYMTCPKVLYEADKNALHASGYDEMEIVFIEAYGKNKIALYVK